VTEDGPNATEKHGTRKTPRTYPLMWGVGVSSRGGYQGYRRRNSNRQDKEPPDFAKGLKKNAPEPESRSVPRLKDPHNETELDQLMQKENVRAGPVMKLAEDGAAKKRHRAPGNGARAKNGV